MTALLVLVALAMLLLASAEYLAWDMRRMNAAPLEPAETLSSWALDLDAELEADAAWADLHDVVMHADAVAMLASIDARRSLARTLDTAPHMTRRPTWVLSLACVT